MTVDEVNEVSCQIIAYAGESKSYSMTAIDDAAEGNFESAEDNLKKGQDDIVLAHDVHTNLLVAEANETGSVPVTMMLVHASNHLSSAELSETLAEKIVQLYKNK